MILRQRYHLRALGSWGLTLYGLVTCACAALLAWKHADADTSLFVLLAYLEVLLPAIAGLLAAHVFADPVLEVLSSLPFSLRRLLAERLFTVSLVVGVGGMAMPVWAWLWRISSPQLYGLGWILVWSAPAMAFIGLGAVGAILARSSSVGALLVGSVWLLQLIFQGEMLLHPAGRVFLLFLTSLQPDAPEWPLNRALLMGLGVLGTTLALAATSVVEPFLRRRE